ncbi:MAG: adenosylcobinamide-GDP ribazoletransferase [Ahrensia sp.]|nr:adenosylcobinamide-GDP ribazoletransferase [Ahrensia sp.]
MACVLPLPYTRRLAAGDRKSPKRERNWPMMRNPDSAERLLSQTMRATGFLSRLPVPARYWEDAPAAAIGDDARTFPLAGVVIAAGPALLLLVLSLIGVPTLMTAVFVTLALVAVTGALHEDGLGDVADGFGGGATKERRLEIMKDSRIGAYAAVAIAGSLMLRVAGLGAIIAAHGAFSAAILLIAVAAASRGSMVWFWARLPNARGEGVAHSAGAPGETAANFAAIAGLAIFAVLGIATSGFIKTAAALLFAIAATEGFSRLCRRMIGGITGDTLGACQQIAEIMLLTGLALGI